MSTENRFATLRHAKETLRFLRTAFRDKWVGAVVPTASRSVRKMIGRLDLSRPVIAVEYGPGTGAVTRLLLKCLAPGSTLLAIERNPDFVHYLETKLKVAASGPVHLILEQGDAQDVKAIFNRHGITKADYVLSGIPFSYMDPATKRSILKETHALLDPAGSFFVYQYSFHMHRYLREAFGAVSKSRSVLNIPPLCIMEAKR